MSTAFSLPALANSQLPQRKDEFVVPVAASRMKELEFMQKAYVPDTDPRSFETRLAASAPASTSSSTTEGEEKEKEKEEEEAEEEKKPIFYPPQPPSSMLNNESYSKKRVPRRSSLVREASQFVEDPFYVREKQNLTAASSSSSSSSSRISPTRSSGSSRRPVGLAVGEMTQEMLLRKGEFDGNSNVALSVRSRLRDAEIADQLADFTSQRLALEQEETSIRQAHFILVEQEAFELLMKQGLRAAFEDLCDEQVLDLESNERSQRLGLSSEQFHAFGILAALCASSRMLIRYEHMWRISGLERTRQILDFANLDVFVLNRELCARAIQKCGRAFSSRRQEGTRRWQILNKAVRQSYAASQAQFLSTAEQLRRRFQVHEVESLEQTSRRVMMTKSFSGLFNMHHRCRETLLVLGEYDVRRRILAEEEVVASGEILVAVNSVRKDLHDVLSKRCAFVVQRRYRSCAHVRNAVAVLQRFLRRCVSGEVGRSWARRMIHKAVADAFEASPVRIVSRYKRRLKRELEKETKDGDNKEEEEEEEEEQKQQEKKKKKRGEKEDLTPVKRFGEERDPFEMYQEAIMCSEDNSRFKLVHDSLLKLQKLYRLCFQESLAVLVGANDPARPRYDLHNFDPIKGTTVSSSSSSSSSSPNSSPVSSPTTRQQEEKREQQQQQEENDGLEKETRNFSELLVAEEPIPFKVELEFRQCLSVASSSSCTSSFLLPVSDAPKPLHLQGSVLRKSKTLFQFLSPFYDLRPIDFSDAEWYQLRGAVDVSSLIAEAFEGTDKESEIYARTIGQLIARRRTKTKLELHREKLQALEACTLKRLELEMLEWNTRMTSSLQMLQEHSYTLLNMDWQRKWMDLHHYCEVDEVVILQYMATQDFSRYKLQVSEVLRGVHCAVVKAAVEREEFVPGFEKQRLLLLQEEKEQEAAEEKKKNLLLLEERKQVQENEQEQQEEGDETDDNLNFYDEDDDVLDFWEHQLLQQQQQQQQEEQENEREEEDQEDEGEDEQKKREETEKGDERKVMEKLLQLDMYDDDEDEDLLEQYFAGNSAALLLLRNNNNNNNNENENEGDEENEGDNNDQKNQDFYDED